MTTDTENGNSSSCTGGAEAIRGGGGRTASEPFDEAAFDAKMAAEDQRYPARKAASQALDKYISEWIEHYEYDDGESGTHSPSDFERFVIYDAFAGLTSDDEYRKLREAWESLCGPIPSASADKAEAVPVAQWREKAEVWADTLMFAAAARDGSALAAKKLLLAHLDAAPSAPLLREAMDRLENIVAKPDYTNPEGMVRDLRAALAKLREQLKGTL